MSDCGEIRDGRVPRVLGAVLVYLLIIALKVSRIEQELADLTQARAGEARWLSSSSGPRCSRTARLRSPTRATRAGPARRAGSRPGACASGGSCRRRCSSSRRLARTASRGTTWAGSLNLFVWLVVGAYLIWGCRPRYRLLGLVVMPLAALLLALVARRGGGTASGHGSDYSTLFLVLHVGLVLAAFAGFTLAAGLAALYLWQERRLKRRERGGPALPRAVAPHARALVGAHDRRRAARCSRSGSPSASPAAPRRSAARRADGASRW